MRAGKWARVELSIVIGTYNRRDLLAVSIQRLFGAVRSHHEIIVIDAGSTDGTWEFLQNRSGICAVQDGGRIGQAASYNRIFKALKSEYTCWLSDDNVVLHGALDLAVGVLDRNPSLGMVALKTKDVTGPHRDLPYIGGIWPSGVLNCNQGIIRTGLLSSLGGFDEQFRDYGIDADLTTRVLVAGFEVAYTKKMAIHHHRDHDTQSWIDSNGRKQRLQVALRMYERKFAWLIENAAVLRAQREPQAAGGGLCFVRRNWQRMNRIAASLGRADIYCERDWDNVAACPFISQWDLLQNITKSYYLVQRMPGIVRRAAT